MDDTEMLDFLDYEMCKIVFANRTVTYSTTSKYVVKTRADNPMTLGLYDNFREALEAVHKEAS